MVYHVLREVGDVAPVGRPLDVQIKVFTASLSYPCTPTGCEIDHVLAVLKGDWNLAVEANPVSFNWKGQLVNDLSTLAKASALLPLPDFSAVLISPFAAWVAFTKPEPEGAVFHL